MFLLIYVPPAFKKCISVDLKKINFFTLVVVLASLNFQPGANVVKKSVTDDRLHDPKYKQLCLNGPKLLFAVTLKQTSRYLAICEALGLLLTKELNTRLAAPEAKNDKSLGLHSDLATWRGTRWPTA